jgi:Ser/Thr protein kinase RdoA (MazF antagonist)
MSLWQHPGWLTRSVITEPALASLLSRYWDLTDVRVTVHNGGMGSQTWFVDVGAHRLVAKAVAPHDGDPFAGGLAIAARLEQAGIPAGAPVVAADGRVVVDTGDGWLALLTWVPGQPLAGTDETEQRTMGTTLARVHRALADYEIAAASFHWVDPDADYLSLRPWLRPAIVSALDALDAVRPDDMTWGLLHADPAPEAFRLDAATGRCGVIDWSYALRGPLLYDVASAVRYLGGPDHAGAMVSAYLDEGVLGAAEIEAGMAAMLRFRWAVQANYFSWRIAVNNLTGIDGPEENEKGLEDARRALAS